MKLGNNNILQVVKTDNNGIPYYVNKIYKSSNLVWEDPYEKKYLIFTALEDNFSINFNTQGVTLTPSILQYSINDGKTWLSFPDSNSYTNSVKKGHRILVRGSTTGSSHGQTTGCGTFSATSKFKVSGHPYALFSYDVSNNTMIEPSASTALTRISNVSYASLFKNCTNLIEVSKNFLYATTITNYCYSDMFYGCNNLISAPNLPANIHQQGVQLGTTSYLRMFYNCESLISGPDIYLSGGYSKSNSDEGIFVNMFYGCSSLLVINYLADLSNLSSFIGNFGSSTGAFKNWVYGVNTNGTFVRKSTLYNTRGNHGIPTNWTISTISSDNT